jgi:hypothetical protein
MVDGMNTTSATRHDLLSCPKPSFGERMTDLIRFLEGRKAAMSQPPHR